jgi:adenine-specific DNA-methyltransferase
MPTLNWLDRELAVKASEAVPFRVLDFDPNLSAGDPAAENLIIQGDNLDAVKAVMPYFAGRVKCFAIDGPYNTRSAFEHYDDNLEHSTWLSMMYPRLELMRDLLSEDGSIWACIDDNEAHYLKVIMDEVFGRKNFVACVVWQKVYTVKNSARQLSDMHDYVLLYAKNGDTWKPNLVPRSEKQDKAYRNPDNDPRGPWKATPLHARNPYSQGLYDIVSPLGRIIRPPRGTYWRFSKDHLDELMRTNQIWWGQDGNSIPSQKRFLSDVKEGLVPSTWWSHSEAGHNAEAKNEIRALLSELVTVEQKEKAINRRLT